MVPYIDRKRVMLWLQEVILLTESKNLLPPADLKRIRETLTLEWSTRMAKAIGYAHYDLRKKVGTIRLSAILWEVAPETEKRETVFHEFAHIVVDIDRANKPLSRGVGKRSVHGPDWRYVMHHLGYPNASRCHNVVNEAYERSRGNFPIYCECREATWVPWLAAVRTLSDSHVCSRCKSTYYMRLENLLKAYS